MRLVLFFSIAILVAGQFVQAAEYRRTINLEWDGIEGAATYDVEIQRTKTDKKTKPRTYSSSTPSWEGPLDFGSYTLRVRGKDKRKVPGDWSEAMEFQVNLETAKLISPKPQAQIFSKDEQEQKTTFTWKAIGGAESYQVEVKSEDGKFEYAKKIRDTSLTLSLPVAKKYTWKVYGLGPNNLTSDAMAVDQVAIMGPALQTPKVTEPNSEYVREIDWSQPEFAETYDYVLHQWDPATKKWVAKKKEVQSPLQKAVVPMEWPGGKYQVTVRANANNRASSKPTTFKFDVASGDRSPAAEENATIRQSIERTSGWFFIASYLITQMQYQGKNSDNPQNTSFDISVPGATGGTGRLGLGFLSEKTPWGFIGIMDYSGFVIDSKVYNFASAEGNIIYRSDVGERGEFRQQIGGFYKDLPVLLATDFQNQQTSTEKVTAFGPHYGVEYWHAFTPKFGFQVNAHAYLSMLSLKTPNGNKASPDLSMQFGLMGSYRLTRKATGLVGYTFRKDSLSYLAGNGDKNTATIMGNYINFFLEWAL